MKKDIITLKLTREEVDHLLDALEKQIEFFDGFEGGADDEIKKSNNILPKLLEALQNKKNI